MNVHTVSIKGLRDQNEDQHDVVININGKNKNLKNVNYYAVYDGHGGKEVSKYVKDNLSKYFVDKRIKYPISKDYVNNVYDFVQRSLKKQDYSYYSGTTNLSIIHFKNNNKQWLNVINIGDSRCVICRSNLAMPLTIDHKPNWPIERARITQIGGKITFDGYDYRIKDLSVSRAFGDVDATPYVTHRPDLYKYQLDNSDKFIVLACDGLWDVLTNQDVVNFVLSNSYDNSLKKRINKDINIAKKLANYALKKGSTDNITIIIVFLD